MKGKLYLIPNTLGSQETNHVIPEVVAARAVTLKHFVVEDLRNARRYLKLLDRNMDIDGSQFYTLNKHSTEEEWTEYLKPMKEGHDMGLISEAGCPGVADPGAELVRLAHDNGFEVVPLVGPSSILLSIMASGMNGQSFAFNGYIPIKKDERVKALKRLENRSRAEHQSQVFIETPFRNMQLLEDILVVCSPLTRLCIACDVTLPDQYIRTKTVGAWKSASLPNLHKKQVVFIIQG